MTVRGMTKVMKDDTELFKQFMANASFKRRMSDAVFGLAYARGGSNALPPNFGLDRALKRPINAH